MRAGFDDDYTSAIFGAIADTVKKVALLVIVPVFGHFIGLNCQQAPAVIASVRLSGLRGLTLTSDMDLAMMPLYWVGTLMLGLTHVLSALYLLVLGYAILKLWLADEEWWRGAAIILIGQPLHTWYVLSMADNMTRGDLALSALLIGAYEVAAISATIWYWRQRQSAA